MNNHDFLNNKAARIVSGVVKGVFHPGCLPEVAEEHPALREEDVRLDIKREYSWKRCDHCGKPLYGQLPKVIFDHFD